MASLARRCAVPLPFFVVALLATFLAAGPARSQSLEVVPDTTRVTVGDPVTLRVVPHLSAGASPPSGMAVPAGDLPEGFRILSSDSLTATAGGGLEGRLRVAFFRPGKQSVPPLVLAYAPGPGAPADTLRSQSVPIEVVPVLPAGDQTLRDIKDLAPLPQRSNLWLWFALAAVAVAAAILLARRLRRRPAPAPVAVVSAPPPADARTPYERALERLAAIERARLSEHGEVARHYDLVTDALRRYLEELGAAPALELTTAELGWALPPALAAGGMREAGLAILEEADLVKFARVRPSGEAPARMLRRARSLLDDWQAASVLLAPAAAAVAASATHGLDGAAGSAGAYESSTGPGPAGPGARTAEPMSSLPPESS